VKILIPILLTLLAMGCTSRKTLWVQGAASITGNTNSDLVVITFNVQDLYFAGKDRKRRMEWIGHTLATLNPDVVGVQEAFIGKDRAVLQKQLIDSRLQNYAFFDYGTVNSGLLILSAFPILETEFHPFTNKGKWYKIWQGDYWAGKGIAMTRLSTLGGELEFYNTHAQASYHKEGERDEYGDVRMGQMREIRDFLKNNSNPENPAIFTGDFNCSDRMPEYNFLVKEANLQRMLTVATEWDHVFAVRKTNWEYTASSTRLITTAKTENGEEIRLSDHDGYMTTITIKNKGGTQ
jgi:endonuclease/exonuclease/phosphatase family metal-dependent hydrolase